jgi:hypothetical protein
MTALDPEKKKSQFSAVGLAVKLLAETLFPSLLVWRIQSMASKASFAKDEWVARQVATCRATALALLLVSAGALFFAKQAAQDFQGPAHAIDRPLASAKKKQFRRAWHEAVASASEGKYKDVLERIGLILLLPAAISLYIRTQSEILVKTRKLEKVLRANGFAREGKLGLAVFLPIGIVIDVTGHNPKDLVFNKTIWVALNIEIDERDWVESPSRRSIVLFKRAFTLAPEYIYK